MSYKTTVVSGVLATLASICFVAGITLLTSEGSAIKDGTHKKITIND